jgi:1,4-alpha-glucan branching enzyme
MSVGTFCLVLHSHLPWLAHHGTWPVGEEWLHQAWARSYGPVFEVLRGLANDGFTNMATIGVTPVLAAQLDDPYVIAQHDIWLADWQLRAIGRASHGTDQQRITGQYEFQQAHMARERFDELWSRGGSPPIRQLLDAGVIDLLGGPATHPFQPLLDPRIVDAGLQVGRDDARWRYGRQLLGIWAPECGYRPGLEHHYAAAGIEYFMVDGPTLNSGGYSTAIPWLVGETVVFGRDLPTSYRVWSPKKGYPGGRWYQDFHTYDHEWGFKPARVTSGHLPPEAKAPYDPKAAHAAVAKDAQDFVAHLHSRMIELQETTPHPIVVAAYDTELFGHWWHEGPAFLDTVLRELPRAGINVSTLAEMRDRAHHAAELPAGSWGSGKDWRVWDGQQVAEYVEINTTAQATFLNHIDERGADVQRERQPYLDDALQELLLTLSSDWAFMETKDSAAQYARNRAHVHAQRLKEILQSRSPRENADDRVFGYLDARGVIPHFR